MSKSALEPTKRKAPLGTKGKVPCPYCPETFRRAEGRAAHIRYSHPGMPYRSNEAAAKGRVPTAQMVEEGQAAPEVPPEAMTTRQHLITAIRAINCRQQSMRAIQETMEGELKVLVTALATLDATSVEAVQESLGA